MENFTAIMQLLAGLGVLMMGFKLMSDNMEKIANSGLRSLFNKTSKNPVIGVAIGAAATMIIQSSGATTVMIVGFVNSGLMSLYQATAMIMGANIGTTITAHIASLNELPVSDVAMALCLVGIALNMFTKKDKSKTVGLLVAGLGFIFVGLGMMSGAISVFKEYPVVRETLQKINNPFLLVFIGFITTAIVQSSSAITSILIAMAGEGLTIGGGGNAVLFIILGTNIGSCTTAVLSAFSANANGKRAAFIHILFNTLGSVIFFIILCIFKDFMNLTFARWFASPSSQIAMFHTFFNVACTVLFLPASKLFVAIAARLFKDKGEVSLRTTHLDDRVLRSPAVAIDCADREIVDAADVAMDAVKTAFDAFLKGDTTVFDDVTKKIETVNEMGRNITEYAVKISASQISFSDEQRLGKLHFVVADVVRVSELADNILKHTRRSVNEQMVFSESVKAQLAEMVKSIENLFGMSVAVFSTKDTGLIPEIDKLEDSIDNMRRALVQGHIDRLSEGKCQPKSSGVFINLVGNLERVADHINSIAHSVE
ncbi:MAG: Na/Pi cotransporter family protein [Christensenellaceae bacterium]